MEFKIYISMIFLSLFSFSLNANIFPTGEQRGNIVLKKLEYKNQEIKYFIYQPSKKELKKSKKNFSDTTMYLIFHGESSKAEDFLNKTNLHSKIKADKNSFIAFNSTANNWFSHERKNIKDNNFILNIINETKKFKDFTSKYKNIKIIAYSSGASLVNKLICENKLNQINKYILINGSGKKEWLSNCNVYKNKNIILINSKKDDYYYYEESYKDNKTNEKVKQPEDDFITIKEYSNNIRIKQQCNKDPITSEIDNVLEDSSHIEHEIYSCKKGNNMEIYLLHNAGHNIPQTVDYNLEDFRGVVNRDINIYTIINR